MQDDRKAADHSARPGIRIIPKLLMGAGGVGLGTIVKVADRMASFTPSASSSSCANVRLRKKATCEASCARLCHAGAISIADTVSIDSSKCTSCNVCVTACPHGVFDSKIPSDASLFDRVLAARKARKDTVRFACNRCNGRYGRTRRKGTKHTETIDLPCLGSLSETLPLFALRLGFKVIVDPCAEDCGFSEGRRCYGLAMKRYEAVRDSFVVRPYAQPTPHDNGDAHSPERREFILAAGKEILRALLDIEAPRRSIRASNAYEQSVPPRRKELRSLTKDLEPRPGRATSQGYPLLDIRIDEEVCTVCGVCARICPTGALRTQHSRDTGAILFDLGNCTGCRLCIEACPERCVSCTVADLAAINSEEKTLARKLVFTCKSCGLKFVDGASVTSNGLCKVCEKRKRLLISQGAKHK